MGGLGWWYAVNGFVLKISYYYKISKDNDDNETTTTRRKCEFISLPNRSKTKEKLSLSVGV